MQQPRVRLRRIARVEKMTVRTSQKVELLTITWTKRSQVVKKMSSCSSVTCNSASYRLYEWMARMRERPMVLMRRDTQTVGLAQQESRRTQERESR